MTSTAPAGAATFDLHLDRDRNTATGCTISTADGPVSGIDFRLRTTVDPTTEEVTAITHATCVGGSFGAETPTGGVATPPWAANTGEGTTGSTLIETQLPLSLVPHPFSSVADAYVTLANAALEDALTSTDGASPGGGIPLPMSATPAPVFGLLGWAMLAFALVVGAWALPPSTLRTRSLLALWIAFGLASPMIVRAALGDGALRSWSPTEEVAADLHGDAAEGADILRLFSALDLAQDTLFVRLDALFGPPVCLDWSLVDPGTGYPCHQEPPPDQGPFGFAVAMTFDDGPSVTHTPSILATLRSENVPATFFMLGKRLETAAEQAIALEIHQDPLFQIANHTYDHTDLTTVSQTDVANELETTAALLRQAAGDECLFVNYFRFPRGRADCDSMEVVREHGYAVAGVNVDPVDWCYADGDGYCSPSRAPWVPDEYRNDMPGYAVTRLLAKGGGIMLMHDIHQNTANELAAVISALRNEGATFVRLDDLALFPVLNANIDPPEPPACCDGTVN